MPKIFSKTISSLSFFLLFILAFLFLFFLIAPTANAQSCRSGWFSSYGECCRCRNGWGGYGPVRCCNPPGGSGAGGCSTYNVNGCAPDSDPDPTLTPSPEPTPTEPPPPVVITPFPVPYVPCDETRTPEFHSLRPYQASPCNQEAEDLALFCGNDFVMGDTITITKYFIPHIIPIPWWGGHYEFEGEMIGPSCLQDADCGIGSTCTEPATPSGIRACSPGICPVNEDGTEERCMFSIERLRSISIDPEGAYLPIMGNTELVVNSQNQPDPEPLIDSSKVNEYVSWFLNGVIGRAEYDQLDIDEEEDLRKLIDYSGPMKKLLPQEIQTNIREAEIDDAREDDIRHNQITVCTGGACYPGLPGSVRRMTNTPDRFFSNVPFSSTEDRIGLVELMGGFQPFLPDVIVTNLQILNQDPAELFFAHMQETVELAIELQRTFIPESLDINNLRPTRISPVTGSYCDLINIRSNPGDNLFATIITADIYYVANVYCDFFIPGNGTLCENLVDGTCQVVPDDWICDTDYGPYDCESGHCIVGNCSPPPEDTCNLWYSSFYCYPISWPCEIVFDDPLLCAIVGGKCATGCTRPTELPPLEQECTVNFNVFLNTITETPLANEVWGRLVAGPSAIFKRIFPKIDEGQPIEGIVDIPGATKVTFITTGGIAFAGNPGMRRGTSAELYFPHLGGVHEYFLKCIQKTLRPLGHADEACMSGDPAILGTCGENFTRFNPPGSTTPQAADYFRNYLYPNITPEILEVYAQAEAITGVPCEVLAGIHAMECGIGPNCSLISGRPIGSPEPDQGGAVFGSLLETAIRAGEVLISKRSDVPIEQWDMDILINALSWYNGGGNRNCGTTPYTGPCPPPIGIDDPYAVSWLDSSHMSMWLRYCADHTLCQTPQPFLRPGALTVAIEFYNTQ